MFNSFLRVVSSMANAKKLEIICLKTVIESGLEIDGESVPAPLLDKLREMREINGNYATQDNLDRISNIEVYYDGETINLSILINGKLHYIFCKKHTSTPINKALLHLVDLNEHALMEVDIFSNGDSTIVELSCKDSGWKWSLSLEIRYIIVVCYKMINN